MKKTVINPALHTINALHGKRKSTEEKKAHREAWNIIRNNMTEMTVDINAAEWDVTPRYSLLEADIPGNKRGNLSKYAGRRCYIINTTITRTGARINFYIAPVN